MISDSGLLFWATLYIELSCECVIWERRISCRPSRLCHLFHFILLSVRTRRIQISLLRQADGCDEMRCGVDVACKSEQLLASRTQWVRWADDKAADGDTARHLCRLTASRHKSPAKIASLGTLSRTAIPASHMYSRCGAKQSVWHRV